MAKANITVSIPPLPEGWTGTPDELLEFFGDNATFEFDGDFPTGQVGGTRPTQDIGIYYTDNSIEKFTNGAYHPITDVPIGCMLPWASAVSAIPENYLLCDGRSILKADYPELFAITGVTWGTDADTNFNLPDMRGRVPAGSGIGDYVKQGLVGRMKEITIGQYFGYEWLRQDTTVAPGAPLAAMKTISGTTLVPAKTNNYVSITPPIAGMPWLIRAK